MDYRCPICRTDLGKRGLGGTVVVRLEIDCSHCRNRIRVNFHRAEIVAYMLSFAALVVLAALAYWLRSQNLVLLVFAAAMIGALASPVIERVFLRTWPRYAPPGGSQGD